MSDQPVFSFLYDRQAAGRVFRQIGGSDLVLAVLAGITPETEWDGCEVYLGPTPEDPTTTACVGIRGTAADEVQRSLVEAFEGYDIPIPKIYQGGPEVQQCIARAEDGCWVTP